MKHKALSAMALWTGPLGAVSLGLLLYISGFEIQVGLTAGITFLCAVWWVFEPLPIPATSLLPLALFPLTGILTGKEVAHAYGHPMILLLLGGFMLSRALEKSGAHQRIALGMIRLFGTGSEKKLIFGFMAASAMLSMWISNTATTLMLLPVAQAALESSGSKKMATPLFLGIAYSASVGGLGTPVGSPPNLIFLKSYGELTGHEPGFLSWAAWGMPVVFIFLPLMGLWLTREVKGRIKPRIPRSGLWSKAEIRVLGVFALTAFFWITRKEPFGGWSGLLDLPTANDASVALMAIILLFIIPGNQKDEKLLDWETANTVPWGILILFGGGLAIATAFNNSGLSVIMGQTLSGVGTFPVVLILAVICLFVTFLTEITSNTATVNLLMPVLASASVAANVDPFILMLPAALSASCAFMLPVATAPNTIVFGSGKISIESMVREGFILNLIGVLVISLITYLFI